MAASTGVGVSREALDQRIDQRIEAARRKGGKTLYLLALFRNIGRYGNTYSLSEKQLARIQPYLSLQERNPQMTVTGPRLGEVALILIAATVAKGVFTVGWFWLFRHVKIGG